MATANSAPLVAFGAARKRGLLTAAEAEAADASEASLELELRFPRATAEQFSDAITALAEGKLPGAKLAEGGARLTLSISENVGSPPAGSYGRGGKTLRTANIHELEFVGGRRTGIAYRRKTQIAPSEPIWAYGSKAYTLAASTEEPLSKGSAAVFADMKTMCRAKARMSWTWEIPAAGGSPDGPAPPIATHVWRLDATIVRECRSGDVAERAMRNLNRPMRTPEEFAAAALVLGDAVGAVHSRTGRAAANLAGVESALEVGLAKVCPVAFELEAEYVGGAGADGLPLPPAAAPAPLQEDLDRTAELVLRTLRPDYLVEASYQEQLRGVAKILRGRRGTAPSGYDARRPLRLKRVLPQVEALDREVYGELHPRIVAGDFFGTPKADGDRALALLYRDRISILGPQLVAYRRADAPLAPPETEILAVLDGEYIVGDAHAFYAFDAIYRSPRIVAEQGTAGDVPVARLPFEGRLGVIPALVAEFGKIVTDPPLAVTTKEFVRLRGADVAPDSAPGLRDAAGDAAALKAGVVGLLGLELPFETDGLVFVEARTPYANTRSFKWKPPSQKTIDVYLRRVDGLARRDKGVGGAIEAALGHGAAALTKGGKKSVYFLFVGSTATARAASGIPLCPGYDSLFRTGRGFARGNHGDYHAMQLSPPVDPYAYVWLGRPGLDRQVVEMRVEKQLAPGGRLQLAESRVRADRARDVESGGYYGNDQRIAGRVISEALHPLTVDELASGLSQGYFATEKGDQYRAATRFTSMIKEMRIRRVFSGTAWVADFASGKGQDLLRYGSAGVRNLVAFDLDIGALVELTSRHSQQVNRRDRKKGPTSGLRLFTVQADLGAIDPRGLRAILQRMGAGDGAGVVDGLVCNLAAHYFAATRATVAAFARLCSTAVRPGGHVVLTIMRGEAVHSRLAAAKDTDGDGHRAWSAVENGKVKYRIEQRYDDGPLAPAGQKVGVLLPFSRGELYEEFLLNEAALIAAFDVADLELREQKSFEEHLAEQSGATTRLTKADRDHLALYGDLVFQKR
jgi:hypothetical protein